MSDVKSCELCKTIFKGREGRYKCSYKKQEGEPTILERLQLFDIFVKDSSICKCYRQIDSCEAAYKVLQKWRDVQNKENNTLKRNRSPSIKVTPGFRSKRSRLPLKSGLENMTFDIADYDVIGPIDEEEHSPRKSLFKEVSQIVIKE